MNSFFDFSTTKKYYRHLDTTLLALNKFEAEFLIFAEQKDPTIVVIKENLEKNRISFNTLTEKSNSLYENYISALNGSSSNVSDEISPTQLSLKEFVLTQLNTYLGIEKRAFEKLKNSQNSNVLKNSISEVYSKVFDAISQNLESLKASLQDIDLLRTNKEKLSELIRILLQVQQFHLEIDNNNLIREFEIENKKIQTKLKDLRESTEGQVFVSQALSVFQNFIDSNNAYTNFLSTTATKKNESLNKSFESEYILGNLATEGKQLLENLAIPIIFPFLYKGNLALTYKRFNSNVAEQIVNYMLSNALMKIPAGNLLISYVDLNNAGIGLKQLRNLDREILKVITEEKDFNNLLDQLKSMINRNAHIIDDTTQNIGIYNTERFIKNKPLEQTNLIVVSGYCPKEFSSVLNYCLRLGPKAGVNFIFQFEEEELNNDEKLTTVEVIGQKKKYFKPLLSFENYGQIIEINENEAIIKSQLNFLHNRKFNPISLDQTMLTEVVENVNRDKEFQNGAILFENYVERFYPNVTEWFKNTETAKSIDAAIGEDKNGNKQFFEVFTSGNKAGLVHTLLFGATGRGKSVMLHAIITSLALKYDPNYLQFYLIDLKEGTEFQRYENTLPHAKLIAKKTDVEFVYHVLKNLEQEIIKRAAIFINNGVKDIEEYHSVKGHSIPMARLVVVLDEYQRLFEVKGFKEKIEGILMIVLKQGRSYGINVIFATQNPGDTGSNMNLGQIAVRIAMPAPPDTIRQVFDTANKFPNQLKVAGDALYNTNYGRDGVEDNVLFKGYYIEKNHHNNLLETLKNHAEKQRGITISQKIFDGNIRVDISENKEFENIEDTRIGLEKNIWLGAPMNLLESHLKFQLNYASENNVLLIGGVSLEAQHCIINTCLLNVLSHIKAGMAAFRFFDYTNYESNTADFTYHNLINKLELSYDIKTVGNDKNSIFDELNLILKIIENRENDNLEIRYPLYNFFLNINTIPTFKRNADLIELLSVIIEKGPQVGVFNFFQADTLLRFKQIFESNMKKVLLNFEHTISLHLKAESSYDLFGDMFNTSLMDDLTMEENKGLYYNKRVDKIEYFKLYTYASISSRLENMSFEIPSNEFKFLIKPIIKIDERKNNGKVEEVKKNSSNVITTQVIEGNKTNITLPDSKDSNIEKPIISNINLTNSKKSSEDLLKLLNSKINSNANS